MTEHIHNDDSRLWLDTLDADSFAACITDPPYELGFMGKDWDKRGIASDPDFWRKVFRVLKPGAHLAAFGGTRTYHRITCSIEDAGFEIRDCLMWTYGQGFPKSRNVSKAIDKEAGAEREVVGSKRITGCLPDRPTFGANDRSGGKGMGFRAGDIDITANATPEAAEWDGWGTALKPAWEPIILARKPFKGTVAANVLEHGTGAVNVGACKIGTELVTSLKGLGENRNLNDDNWKGIGSRPAPTTSAGRWPANVILQHSPECVCVGTRKVKTGAAVERNRDGEVHNQVLGARKSPAVDDATYGDGAGNETIDLWACVPGCPVRMMDEQSGKIPSSFRKASRGNDLPFGDATGVYEGANLGYTDAGGASRFFFNAKASTSERSAGLPDGERNLHPTVKPIEVMRWLARLLTPPGGTILEPFCGSGTTACACELEGFDYEACEKDKAHVRTSRLRAIHWRGVAEKAALEEANRTPLLDMLEAAQRKDTE